MHSDENHAIASSDFEDVRVVTLRGEWDVSNRERLRDALVGLGTERDVVVDLRQASFFDSTALAELIGLYKRLGAQNRRLEALVGSSNMRRLLELTSLDGLIGVAPTRAKYLEERLPVATWQREDDMP
jgi:anti-anti-sigma factor